ncbi:hypothetical protein [Lentilactobacillus hilgardii]|uniref:hypothetical protein n=1 Tax=Lentilactobacillus hilgardii TaxID=1588 RepID=UPI0021C29F9A|nr:hypothetical protein [Lentilactobacillus hilgardii]MCP9334263.1 hypothetical protein [Lentilactobacillus hilgardii]MCP9350856.1 hypothetical protein [Lentilactobacillus hilgardii]MCP9353753.1 hypothetical protein [Lentilactobacillus hilgardii]
MTDDFNHLTSGIEQLEKLQTVRLSIGVPWTNQRLNMIALVNEYGADIKPKNKACLIIPTKEAKGRKPGEIANLFRPKPPHNHVLAVPDKSQPYGMRIMFILKDEVHIPPRPFLRYTFDHYLDNWTELAAVLAFKVFIREINYQDTFPILGDAIVKDIKRTIKEFSEPKNAPLTIANKGFDDPLIEKGELRDSIHWITERI